MSGGCRNCSVYHTTRNSAFCALRLATQPLVDSICKWASAIFFVSPSEAAVVVGEFLPINQKTK